MFNVLSAIVGKVDDKQEHMENVNREMETKKQ